MRASTKPVGAPSSQASNATCSPAYSATRRRSASSSRSMYSGSGTSSTKPSKRPWTASRSLGVTARISIALTLVTQHLHDVVEVVERLEGGALRGEPADEPPRREDPLGRERRAAVGDPVA